MNGTPDVVAFACIDPQQDRCGLLIFDELQKLTRLEPTGITVDGLPVLRARSDSGRVVDVVRTKKVLSHDLSAYVSVIRSEWMDARVGLLLNWHEGAGAPDRILPMHSTGDVPSGIFGASDPDVFQSVLRAFEESRLHFELYDYSVTTEATHWSGTQYGLSPDLIAQCPIPVIDVEVGSSPECWNNPRACAAVARTALTALDHPVDAVHVLYIGGVHFEPSCREAAFAPPPQRQAAFGHILANQWINGTHYEGNAGLDKLRAAAASIRGGVDVVAFHDKMRAPLKDAARAIATELGVPAINHRRLRDGAPENNEQPPVTHAR